MMAIDKDEIVIIFPHPIDRKKKLKKDRKKK